MSLSPLQLLLDFDAQYRRDQQHTPDFLHRRDRRLALARQRQSAPPMDISAWLTAVAAPSQRKALNPWRRGRRLFTLAGAVLGVLTMLGLLYTDGQGRVNVTLILALAFLQLILALATTGQALSGRRPWGRLLNQGAEQKRSVLTPLQPQLAARIAHSAGLAFAITALLTLLTQVLVRDLAFGWSTTLQTSAPDYHGLMQQLAWPWRSWLPIAVPDLELVEQSRYFRLAGSAPADPEVLGAWWPFLTLSWLSYVVAPRLLLLVVARQQLNRCARAQLNRHPGHVALWERFALPWLDTGGQSEPASPDLRTPINSNTVPLPDEGVVIRWAGAGTPELAQGLLKATPMRVLEAGGAASLEQDLDTLARANLGKPITILTRGWEPPTGELADFLEDAHQRWPADTRIILLPLASDQATDAVSAALLNQWQRFLTAHPAVRLCLP